MVSMTIREAGRGVKRIQLFWSIFMNQYTVSFANPGAFRPVIRLMYIKDQQEKILEDLEMGISFL